MAVSVWLHGVLQSVEENHWARAQLARPGQSLPAVAGGDLWRA